MRVMTIIGKSDIDHYITHQVPLNALQCPCARCDQFAAAAWERMTFAGVRVDPAAVSVAALSGMFRLVAVPR